MQELFSFGGLVNRTIFWVNAVCEFLLFVVLGAFTLSLYDAPFAVRLFFTVAFLTFFIGLFLVALATSVKRCHDLDKSGWWCLVPVWNVIVLPFFVGTQGGNRFGPRPPSGTDE